MRFRHIAYRALAVRQRSRGVRRAAAAGDDAIPVVLQLRPPRFAASNREAAGDPRQHDLFLLSAALPDPARICAWLFAGRAADPLPKPSVLGGIHPAHAGRVAFHLSLFRSAVAAVDPRYRAAQESKWKDPVRLAAI